MCIVDPVKATVSPPRWKEEGTRRRKRCGNFQKGRARRRGEGGGSEGIFTRARLRGVFVKGPGGRGESINFWENETAGRKVGFFLYVCMGGRIFRMVEENGTRR